MSAVIEKLHAFETTALEHFVVVVRLAVGRERLLGTNFRASGANVENGIQDPAREGREQDDPSDGGTR